jgi:hypothetical protein
MVVSVLTVVLAGAGLYWKRRSVEAAPPTSGEAESMIELEVQADAPGASLSMYGRTFPLPFHGAVERSAAAVSVEITALGREGRLYALPMQEPQSIAAKLPAGDGMKKATKEEAFRALLPQ